MCSLKIVYVHYFLVSKDTQNISLYYCKTFENQKVLDDHAYIISSYPFLKSLSDILGYKCN